MNKILYDSSIKGFRIKRNNNGRYSQSDLIVYNDEPYKDCIILAWDLQGGNRVLIASEDIPSIIKALYFQFKKMKYVP